MQGSDEGSLRDFLLEHAARQGWHTQRHIAVCCGLDESALSRFLSGEQDLGAWRTHALFRAVGVPAERYDVAYVLLAREQAAAGDRLSQHRRRQTAGSRATAPAAPVHSGRSTSRPRFVLPAYAHVAAPGDEPLLPAAVVTALFGSRGYTSAEIAAFFGG